MPYEIEHYARDSRTMLAPTHLAKVHPLGKSPVITDGDATIAESGAIIEYLVDMYGEGKYKPQRDNNQAYRDYLYWMHYAEGSVMPFLVMRLVFDQIEARKLIFPIKQIVRTLCQQVHSTYLKPNIEKHMHFVEDFLSSHEWLAGDNLSGADIQMSFPLEAMVTGGMTGESFPRIVEYVKKLQARPAYQRALKRAGPYDYTVND